MFDVLPVELQPLFEQVDGVGVRSQTLPVVQDLLVE